MPQAPDPYLAVRQPQERITGLYLNFQLLWHSSSKRFAATGM